MQWTLKAYALEPIKSNKFFSKLKGLAVMDLIKMYVFWVVFVVVTFFGCSAIERIFGKGSVSFLITAGVIMLFVYLMVASVESKHD